MNNLSTDLSIYLFIFSSIYLSAHLYLFIFSSIYLSAHLSIYLLICISNQSLIKLFSIEDELFNSIYYIIAICFINLGIFKTVLSLTLFYIDQSNKKNGSDSQRHPLSPNMRYNVVSTWEVQRCTAPNPQKLRTLICTDFFSTGNLPSEYQSLWNNTNRQAMCLTTTLWQK